MFKYLSLFVLLALAAVVFGAEEVHDQATAEQFFATYGYYPAWYTPTVYSPVRSAVYPYAYGYPGLRYAYPYAGYSYAYYG